MLTFLALYWKWIAAAAVIAALSLVYNSHVNGLIDQAVMENNGKWQKAEQDAIRKAQEDARATEAAHAKDLAQIAANRLKEAANAKKRHDQDVADARSGALSLRVPATCASGPNVSGAASGGNTAPQTATLQSGFTALLVGNADEADGNIDELNTCWQIVASDRRKP